MPLMQGLLAGKFTSADEVPPGRARSRHFSGDRPQARHGEPGAEEETFAAVRAIRAIAEDVGAPMAQVAIAWDLAQPGVTSVITGIRNPEQARANAAAADLELPPDVLEALNRATEPLKRLLGPNADMWQSNSRIR